MASRYKMVPLIAKDTTGAEIVVMPSKVNQRPNSIRKPSSFSGGPTITNSFISSLHRATGCDLEYCIGFFSKTTHGPLQNRPPRSLRNYLGKTPSVNMPPDFAPHVFGSPLFSPFPPLLLRSAVLVYGCCPTEAGKATRAPPPPALCVMPAKKSTAT